MRTANHQGPSERRFWGPILGLWLALCLSLPASAAQVSGIYEAEVPVQDRSSRARSKALLQAFQTVLIKVTGDSNLAGENRLLDGMKNPSRFVRQYQYRTSEDSSREGLRLWVVFDPKALDRYLLSKQVPVWGATRPTVLMWLLFEAPEGRFVLNPETLPQIAENIREAADNRAIPIDLPLMDLQDQAAADVGGLWGGFRDSVERASQRYAADAILVGRIYADVGGGWGGRWSLFVGSAAEQWRTQGFLQQEVITNGINVASDMLASRYAPQSVSSARGQMHLRIERVPDLQLLARLQSYLKQLSAVDEVKLLSVAADVVELELHFRGEWQALRQSIEFGDLLRAKPLVMPLPLPLAQDTQVETFILTP